ncbi:MAG: RapZ C-terminal domain-containing protein [Bacteroidales bacterium]
MKKEISELFKKTFGEEIEIIEKVSATGSNRQYFRLVSENHHCIGTYNPDFKENRAFISYAKQFMEHNVNVPQIYAEDLANNVYLQQDLGDENLFDFLQSHTLQNILPYFTRVMESIAKIQAIQDFDYTEAYPTQVFDRQSMLWDCNYFKYYFLKFFDIQFDERLLENDFNTFIDYLLSCNCNYFVHRDFIPRNIMLFNDELYFIDFQGGRKGSLYYDIASFLFNSKTNLDKFTREYLFDIYLSAISKYTQINVKESTDYFYAYVYMRLIQNMGAYGFRGIYEKKKAFVRSIPFALKNLQFLIENIPLKITVPHLMSCFLQVVNNKKITDVVKENKLTVTIKSFSYKRGYPYDATGNGGGFVFDCRALPNPGREEKFRQMTGLDEEVQQYLERYEEVEEFFSNAMNLIRQNIDNYLKRDFSNLSIYFGCTGGRHRSVYFAQRCAEELLQNIDLNIFIEHTEQNIQKKL